jgi:hypothetical protein
MGCNKCKGVYLIILCGSHVPMVLRDVLSERAICQVKRRAEPSGQTGGTSIGKFFPLCYVVCTLHLRFLRIFLDFSSSGFF